MLVISQPVGLFPLGLPQVSSPFWLINDPNFPLRLLYLLKSKFHQVEPAGPGDESPKGYDGIATRYDHKGSLWYENLHSVMFGQ